MRIWRRHEQEPCDERAPAAEAPMERPVLDPAKAAELAELRRALAAKAEAEAELHRLRRRHWSGERLREEAQASVEWWEHPDADPYAVLGLLPGASIREAASARRAVAQRCHPDRVGPRGIGAETYRRMVAANAAYERLRRALRAV